MAPNNSVSHSKAHSFQSDTHRPSDDELKSLAMFSLQDRHQPGQLTESNLAHNVSTMHNEAGSCI